VDVLRLRLDWGGHRRASARCLDIFQDNEILVLLDDTWMIAVNEDNIFFFLVLFVGGLVPSRGGVLVPSGGSEEGGSEGRRRAGLC